MSTRRGASTTDKWESHTSGGGASTTDKWESHTRRSASTTDMRGVYTMNHTRRGASSFHVGGATRTLNYSRADILTIAMSRAESK